MLKTENLIWVEHRDRELGYAQALARALSEGGCGTTTILSLPFYLPLASLTEARRVFVPFLKGGDDAMLAGLRKPPEQVFSLNFEQLLGHFNREAKRPRLDNAIHVYWYEEFGAIMDQWNVPSCGRVLAPSPESLLVSNRAAEAGLQRGRHGQLFERAIFIPENYAWAFADDELLRKKARAGFDLQQIRRLRAYSGESLAAFARQLLAFAPTRPDIGFFVRPHPSVSVKQYEQVLRRHGEIPPNVVLSKSLSAWDWLGSCDGVLSGWSTVAYSARQIGIPAALHLPLPIIAELDVPFVRAMPQFVALDAAVHDLLARRRQSAHVAARSFESVVAAARQPGRFPCDPKANTHVKRLRITARAALVSFARMLGLWFPELKGRVFSVYREDHFSPIRTG